ncbi:MAG TPA: metallophosphoesterase family protein [Solirubrobacteraceae bacterium]|nr:metallophosphoesterase family protein [Solirubrobacteraceae bacterium]
MLALLYDIHGNLPALEAVLDDARRRGADRWLIGGDVAAFGGRPVEAVDRTLALPAVWIRGNTERWLVDRTDLPPEAPMHEAMLACRAALGDQRSDELAALPESAALPHGAGRAWHGSPVSDMRSFLPEPAPDEAELLQGVTDRRLVFGHTHLQFRREGATAGGAAVELVNPGSVGIPCDGDRRAAYALLHADGAVELRRVAYPWEAAREQVLAVADGARWGAIIAARLEQARFDVEA